MLKDTFDLMRVKNFLDDYPECDVILIANKKMTATGYWEKIENHLGIKKRPWIVTNSDTWDGFPIMDSLVLKLDRWWENRNAKEFMKHTKLAKYVVPITHIPPFIEGGDTD